MIRAYHCHQMQTRPLVALAALAVASSPELAKEGFAELKHGFREKFNADPMGSTMGTVAVGALLFYRAEKGKNPKVKSYYDALVYVSTNLSVGFSDIFAVTPMGKAIGSLLMTYGPAMATRALDDPRDPKNPEPTQRDVVERLDKIFEALSSAKFAQRAV